MDNIKITVKLVNLSMMQHTESSRSHSRNTNFRRPHSIEKTSERIDAEVNVSCTPERSTVRGLVGDVFYKERNKFRKDIKKVIS